MTQKRKSRAILQLKCSLGEISQSIKKGKHSALELTRAASDFEVFGRRFVQGEYARSAFKARNLLTIPDRTEEIYADLEYFWSLASVWSQALGQIKFKKQARILDFGCGYFPKAELGLQYYGFTGQVTLLDIDPKALTRAHKFLDFFQCEFSVRKVSGSLWSHSQKYEAIIANHVIDDFVLEFYARKLGVKLSDLYDSEQLYLDTWSRALSAASEVEYLVEMLVQKLSSLLNTHGMIVLFDYPSFAHRSLKLNKVIKFIEHVQELIRKKLVASGFKIKTMSRTISCVEIVAKPKNWVIAQR